MSDLIPSRLFMTGATGFLGHFILRDLLDRGREVVVMLRPPLADAVARLSHMLDVIGCDTQAHLADGTLQFVEGSLPDGLPDPEWGRTDAVLNCAASLQLFTNGNQEPFATNEAGTAAVIDWANRHGVHAIHAVSTAYTCGWNKGNIPEQFHEPKPGFQTDYEHSKWVAERQLRAWGDQPGHTLTVYRPSFLVGDSDTGYTTQFGGFYQFAWLISVLKQRFYDPNNGVRTHVPVRLPIEPDRAQNIVPVDFAARMVAEVVMRPQFHGRIYHLTNPDPPRNEFIKECYESYFELEGGYFADPKDALEQLSAAESILWDQYALAAPRLQHTPDFDVTNARQVMDAAELSFPQLDQDRVFKLLDYATAQKWGKLNGNGRKTPARS